MSPAEFCRELEAYLCRKNDGHLIRIVGPVFGTVTGWAEQGIPLKVAFKGIDRYFDRQVHKSRRRPVPIQFCEADILDAFDEWRRALGLSATAARSLATPAPESDAGARRAPAATPLSGDESTSDAAGGRVTGDCTDRDVDFGGAGTRGRVTHGVAGGGATGDRAAGDVANGVEVEARAIGAEGHAGQGRRKAALQTHIDRVMARLTQRRVEASGPFGAAIDQILGQLDALRADAKGLRGDARERVVLSLATLDRGLLDAAAGTFDASGLAAVRTEAARDLETFRARMPPEAFDRALAAAVDRGIRERLRLPTIRVDE
jgi:hypothetical protein